MSMRSRMLTFALVAMTATTCADPVAPPPVPVPGALSLRFASPHADDGAFVIQVVGPAISNVRAGSASLVLHSRPDGSVHRAAVFGDVESGAVVLRFDVPDVARIADYSATVVEVADRSNALRADLTGYALVVER